MYYTFFVTFVIIKVQLKMEYLKDARSNFNRTEVNYCI